MSHNNLLHNPSMLNKADALGNVEHTAQTLPKAAALGQPLVYMQNNRLSTPSKDFREVRIERFALKSLVNRWLPTSATAKCLRYTQSGGAHIFKHKLTSKAFYAGTRTCSSVWICPCCAAKISERRREELKQAFSVAEAKGYQVLMLTLTAPHQVTDDLSSLLKKMSAALDTTFVNASGKKFLQYWMVKGRIRALEVTYGENGFHPHFHIVLFVPSSLSFSPSSMEDMIYPLWVNACRLRKLGEPSRKHGVKVDTADKAFNYLAKFGLEDEAGTVKQGWGLDSEMTKSHIKQSKKGLSMFDLLRQYLLSEDDKFRKLFLVYAKAFKGQRQLVWSNGLKEFLSVENKSDEELAIEQTENAVLFASLSFEQWRAVYKTNSEAYVLNCVELHPESFDDLINGLVKLYNIQYPNNVALDQRNRAKTKHKKQ